MVNIQKFIEQYIKLIDNNEWGDIYNIFNMDVSDDGETGDFTRMLLSIGIDPVIQGNMKYIPAFYMYVGNDTNPQEIPITKIEIPEGILSIESHAFYGNKQLKEISLPSTLEYLHDNCFNNCIGVEKITYNGTYNQWTNIGKYSNWYTYGWPCKSIICTDGEYSLWEWGKKTK